MKEFISLHMLHLIIQIQKLFLTLFTFDLFLMLIRLLLLTAIYFNCRRFLFFFKCFQKVGEQFSPYQLFYFLDFLLIALDIYIWFLPKFSNLNFIQLGIRYGCFLFFIKHATIDFKAFFWYIFYHFISPTDTLKIT